jgi:hypothetical protein
LAPKPAPEAGYDDGGGYLQAAHSIGRAFRLRKSCDGDNCLKSRHSAPEVYEIFTRFPESWSWLATVSIPDEFHHKTADRRNVAKMRDWEDCSKESRVEAEHSA